MSKYKTKGAQLLLDTVNPPVTQVGQLGDSSLELGDREALVDATTHDNTTGVTDMIDNGFKAPCKLTGTLIYDPADTVHESIRASQQSGAQLWAKLILANATSSSFLFQCRILKCTLPLPVKGKMELQVEIEGIGAYTFTA